MKKQEQLFSVLVILVVMTMFGYGQSQGNPLLEKHVEIKLNNGSILEAVYALSRSEVEIGFEARADLDVDSDPRISLNDGKVKDILNSLISQDPSYKWEVNDGVINIFPITGRNELITSFLKTLVGPIHILPGEKRISISTQINNSLELQTLQEKSVKVLIFQSTVLGIEDTVSKELNIPRADARTVLNNLIKSEIGSKLWIIKLSDPMTIFITY
jgi:hypothetical protein